MNMSEVEEAIQLIRLSVVLNLTGFSKTGLYESINSGEFPKNVKISERSSAWVLSEVQDFIKKKMDERSQEVNK